MKLQCRIAVPYSLVLVMDSKYGKPPETMGGKLVVSTSSCAAIGTLPDSDGETLIVLTSDRQDVTGNLQLVFNGVIETPNREVSVCTALNQEILNFRSDNERCRLEIWVNDLKTPDQIEILIEKPENPS